MNMNNKRNQYDIIYKALKASEEMTFGLVITTIELSNRRGSFRFRLIGGRVRVKFKPLCRRAKKRRPGERVQPRRKTLIVGKVIIPEWTALSKTASSLREVEQNITRYNKTLKKTIRK